MFDSIKYHLKLNKQSSWFFWWIFFSKLGISPKFQISKIQWNITWGKNKTFWWWSELCFILFLCQVLIFCFFFRPIFCEIMSYLPSSPFPTGNPDSTPMVFGSNFPVPTSLKNGRLVKQPFPIRQDLCSHHHIETAIYTWMVSGSSNVYNE